ncbi:hypothetical protein BV22DRAFT_219091 [Leucogyrophana mollusca]|uniref:Uncharacterized protein n=1 Tax=Leucogyrophana mollusca TaxID=85980 RepID=A0ACB8BS92_9AGAM|nr:hypothetical protein BV22DRAFT_219091 [Leucogyrophana mollusca]
MRCSSESCVPSPSPSHVRPRVFSTHAQKKLVLCCCVLLVCAVASQFSDDPRVPAGGTYSEHLCGWKFFRQIKLVRHTLLGLPCFEHTVSRLCSSSAPPRKRAGPFLALASWSLRMLGPTDVKPTALSSQLRLSSGDGHFVR